MDIKELVDTLVNKYVRKGDSFVPKNYTMRDIYDAEKLVVGKLEYISSDVTEFGPKVTRTAQYYIFEPIIINEIEKYQEVFTGVIVGDSEDGKFDLPYIVDMEKLTEVLEDYKEAEILKLGMLLTLNDVNCQMAQSNDKNIFSKKKANLEEKKQ